MWLKAKGPKKFNAIAPYYKNACKHTSHQIYSSY